MIAARSPDRKEKGRGTALRPARTHFLRFFADGRPAFLVPHTLVQNLPDQATEPIWPRGCVGQAVRAPGSKVASTTDARWFVAITTMSAAIHCASQPSRNLAIMPGCSMEPETFDRVTGTACVKPACRC